MLYAIIYIMKSAALLLFFQQPNRNYILFAILFCKSTPTNRVGEISAFAEISTSHTTVRTVPYTAVQST